MEEINNINNLENKPKQTNYRFFWITLILVIALVVEIGVFGNLNFEKESLISTDDNEFTINSLPEILRSAVEISVYDVNKLEVDNGKFGKVTLEYSKDDNCWKKGSYNAKSGFVETCVSSDNTFGKYDVFGIYNGYAYILANKNEDFVYILLKDEDLMDGLGNFMNGTFTEQDDSGVYKSNSLNITFTIPSGWREINLEELSYLPEFFSEPKLILENEEKSCVIISNTILDRNGNIKLKQTGSGENITDGPERWFAPENNIPAYVNLFDEPVRQGQVYVTLYKNPREKIEGEFKEVKGFYLYDKDGQTVNNDCEKDIETVVLTKKDYYERIALSNFSQGVLRIVRTFLYQDTHKTQSHMLFTPKNTEDNFLVEIMPSGVTGLEKNIIYGSKIYFVANDWEDSSSIKYFDVENEQIGVIEDTEGKYGYVSSIMPVGKDLYYIAGSDEFGHCLDLPKDECLKASLYKYNFDEDSVEMLAEDIKGANILGIDEEGDIYFSLSWGDAGAWFATVYKYNNGDVEVYRTYTDASQIKEYEGFISSLNNIKGYQSILLENGKLLPGPEINDYSKDNYFFVD